MFSSQDWCLQKLQSPLCIRNLCFKNILYPWTLQNLFKVVTIVPFSEEFQCIPWFHTLSRFFRTFSNVLTLTYLSRSLLLVSELNSKKEYETEGLKTLLKGFSTCFIEFISYFGKLFHRRLSTFTCWKWKFIHLV